MTGLGEQAALLQSIGIGATNLIFTFVGLWLIDLLGRKTLLYIGSLGYIASLGLCAWAFFTETFTIVPANFACHTALLGANVSMVSAVGDDVLLQQLRQTYRQSLDQQLRNAIATHHVAHRRYRFEPRLR